MIKSIAFTFISFTISSSVFAYCAGASRVERDAQEVHYSATILSNTLRTTIASSFIAASSDLVALHANSLVRESSAASRDCQRMKIAHNALEAQFTNLKSLMRITQHSTSWAYFEILKYEVQNLRQSISSTRSIIQTTRPVVVRPAPVRTAPTRRVAPTRHR